jgi:protein-disulfide isomerase
MKVKMMMMILFLTSPILAAQDRSKEESDAKPSGNQEAGITKEQAAKIVQELQMIRMLLEKEIDTRAKNSLSETTWTEEEGERTIADLGKYVIGSDKAPLTLIEFVDLQCPYCTQFHNDVLPEITRKYIDTGKLRFAAFDFPLPSHAYALPAAIFARCAGMQGKYWQIYDTFLSDPKVAVPDVIEKVSRDVKLNPKELDQCSKSAETSDEITQEIHVARDLGVYGTPTFLLGRSLANGAVGRIIPGSPSLSTLEDRIQKLLESEATAGTPRARHE